MAEPLIKKPTFKQMYQNFVFFHDTNQRIEMGKKCLLKLIESMPDKMKIALTTFNTASNVIMPLSPKSELKAISHKINSIYPEGDTNLTTALQGAANCLEDSTAKFKRVIIITDGWDDRNNFMDLATELNKKDISITILSIDSGSNSNMYSRYPI